MNTRSPICLLALSYSNCPPSSHELSQFCHQMGPKPVNQSSCTYTMASWDDLIPVSPKRHQGTERFGDLPKDTQLAQGTQTQQTEPRCRLHVPDLHLSY